MTLMIEEITIGFCLERSPVDLWSSVWVVVWVPLPVLEVSDVHVDHTDSIPLARLVTTHDPHEPDMPPCISVRDINA